jgi:hypothetical protein
MPVGLKALPKSWDEIKDRQFYAINGQHTAVAARRMIEDPLCTWKDEVRYWDALIVWSADNADLKAISNYYNLINKINPFKATWGNNLIHTRQTWVSMGRPGASPKQLERTTIGICEVEGMIQLHFQVDACRDD